MADETPSPATGANAPDLAPADAASTEPAAAAPTAPRHKVPWLATLVLCAVIALLLLQGAGLLLRDGLERRQPTLAQAPTLLGEAAGTPAAAIPPGARFGPEVHEVAVMGPDGGPAPQPQPTPLPAAAPLSSAGTPAVRGQGRSYSPAPAPTPPAPTAPSSPAPAPVAPVPAAEPPRPTTSEPVAASHALQVGIFSSQKYRHAMEQQLDAAGVPHFRRERTKTGEGYRLALPLADAAQREQARAILDAAGVLYRAQGATLEAPFHFEADAQLALQHLSAVGLHGGYRKVQGELPLWVVYAGPFALEQAKQVRQQLAIQGLPSYLRRAP